MIDHLRSIRWWDATVFVILIAAIIFAIHTQQSVTRVERHITTITRAGARGRPGKSCVVIVRRPVAVGPLQRRVLPSHARRSSALGTARRPSGASPGRTKGHARTKSTAGKARKRDVTRKHAAKHHGRHLGHKKHHGHKKH